jgi:hypothetical protein
MTTSILSGVVKISKDVPDIERELPKICGGEIIRWAIIDVTDNYYKISFSYKK